MSHALHFPDPPVDALPVHPVSNGGEIASYAASREVTVQLDRIDHLLRMVLRLYLTVSTGATPGTPTARRRNPSSFLGTLRYVSNGKELLSAPMDLFFLRAQWARGQNEVLKLDSLTTAELANGSQTYNAELELPIDFQLPDVGPQQVGIQLASGLPSHQLKFTYGGVSDLMDSAGATQAIATVTPSIINHKTRVAFRDSRGNAIPRVGFGGYTLETTATDITSTRTEHPIELTGGGVYVRFYFRLSSGSTREVTDAVLTDNGKLKIMRGSVVLFECTKEEAINFTSKRLPVGLDRTGWVVIDPVRMSREGMGFISRAWAAPSNEPLKILAGVTTATNARIELACDKLVDVESFYKLNGINPQMV